MQPLAFASSHLAWPPLVPRGGQITRDASPSRTWLSVLGKRSPIGDLFKLPNFASPGLTLRARQKVSHGRPFQAVHNFCHAAAKPSSSPIGELFKVPRLARGRAPLLCKQLLTNCQRRFATAGVKLSMSPIGDIFKFSNFAGSGVNRSGGCNVATARRCTSSPLA